jgi:hypothetical protein
MGPDGAGLSCPGSSEVAEDSQMRSLFYWRPFKGLRQRIVFPLLLINEGLTSSFFGVIELNNDDQLLLSRSNTATADKQGQPELRTRVHMLV